MQLILFLIFLTLANNVSLYIVCTNNSPIQYFKFPPLTKCQFNYKNSTTVKKFELFKPNTIEFVSNGFLCKKIISEVSMYTDISGYEHLIEKEINNKPISMTECQEMVKNKNCEFGTMKKGDHSYHTNNKISIEYPNRFISLFKSKRFLKENCVLIETKIFSHYDQKFPSNVLVDMSNCNYLTGKCQIKSNEILIWDVNKDQNCKYISVGIFTGFLNDNIWINNDNQIALNLKSKFKTDCGNYLQLTSEGFALKSVREKRSTLLVNTFQEAGELQYLENHFEQHLRHLSESFCQIFNDHTEFLEILLKENPKKFMQKVLNYTAIDANLINDTVVQVKFCKEISSNLIIFTDLSDIKGYIPVKLNKYSSKIWYLRDNVIFDEIRMESDNISDIKTLEIKKNYDLRFLKDKLIIREHIFTDLKTNFEEELLSEIRQMSNVDIELEENEQNSMIPHEIIADLDNFWETYWIKYWRIYVTVSVTLVYIFIARSLFYIVSPKVLLKMRKEKENKNENRNVFIEEQIPVENLELKTFSNKRKVKLRAFPSITSLDQEEL